MVGGQGGGGGQEPGRIEGRRIEGGKQDFPGSRILGEVAIRNIVQYFVQKYYKKAGTTEEGTGAGS